MENCGENTQHKGRRPKLGFNASREAEAGGKGQVKDERI